jgi:hypothetical protein
MMVPDNAVEAFEGNHQAQLLHPESQRTVLANYVPMAAAVGVVPVVLTLAVH